ncbi:MAG: SdpI family protein [Candidatus Nanoarchaeia archaeon]|nr:SdpI family protein [Candidatus Nanoarchaeia archaeon]
MNPVKPSIKSEIFCLSIIFLTICFSIYFYSQWPDIIASHWDFEGNVDGYSNKAFMVWIFPVMMSSIYALFLALPYIDPKKKNYEGFSEFYHFFKSLILTIFFILFIGIGRYNSGYYVNITLLSTVSLGVLMFVIGLYLKEIKPNWFMGIKNPWTLSSDKVWKKTHKIGGYFFMVFGIILIICNFLPEILSMILFILGILLIIIGTTVYSYVIYYNESNKKKR